MQWESATITVTYEEGVSSPTASSYSVTLGSSVTLYTNRLNTSQTHTFTYLFGNASGTIGTSITTTATWTPPLSLASQIPNATSGTCAISCVTYSGGVMTGTKVIYLTLQVPDTVKPSISAIAISEAVAGLNAQFGSYVQKKSQLFVQITASGSYGSTISSYRTTMDGSTYSGASYTTGTLNTSGYVTMNFTVTDSRGRTGTAVRTIYVTPYSPPTILNFTAARCNAAGTAAQSDGTRAWVTVSATASSVSSKNTMSCTVYYKLKSSTSWLSATTIAHTSYSVAKTN